MKDRQERLKKESLARMEKRADRSDENNQFVIPGRGLVNYDEVGYTWQEFIPLFETIGIDKLVLLERVSSIHLKITCYCSNIKTPDLWLLKQICVHIM